MAIQSVWVHGNAVIMRFPGGNYPSPHTSGHKMAPATAPTIDGDIPWTDIVGFHEDKGATFVADPEGATNSFMAPIPCPIWRDGVRARLTRVGLKFSSRRSVTITDIRIMDGGQQVNFPFRERGMSVGGGSHCDTWEPGKNYFDVPGRPEIITSVCLVFDVTFPRGDNRSSITFCAAGCDFEV